jgi:pimeloyl-ACP methyl ester carboxylesterase
VASERYAVRRARSRPDPERGEPLAERPAERLTVTSFDGTALDVRIASPSARRKGASGRPTLVFAHGFSLDMTTWHYQWKALSDRYRCVLYDQRGHGASARAGDGGYTIEALGSDLRAVLDATVPHGRAVLLGHSLGGMAILSLAERHPEEFLPGDGGTRQVAAVVLANTASGDLVKEAFGDLAVRTTAMVRRGLMSLARRPALGERLRRAAIGRSGDTAFLITLITNFAPGAPPSLVDHVARVSSSTAAEVWPPFLEDLLDLDLREAEANIRAPALVIVGDRDRLTPAGGARAMAATLPDGRLVVLQGAGHLAMLERHEEFTAAVDAFLDDVAVRASIPVGETGT